MSCTIFNIQSPDGHDEDVVAGGGDGWCFGPRPLPKSATVAVIFGGAGDGVVICDIGVDVDAVLTAAAPTWLPSSAATAAAVGVPVSSRPNIPAELYNNIIVTVAYELSPDKTFYKEFSLEFLILDTLLGHRLN